MPTDATCCTTCKVAVDAINTRIDEVDRRQTLRSDYIEKIGEKANVTAKEAVTKAESTQDRRLDGMNEFRDQLNDQAGTFITRDVFSIWTDRVTKLERWPWAIAGLFVAAIAIFGVVMKLVGG